MSYIDRPPAPGDIVLVRGDEPVSVWSSVSAGELLVVRSRLGVVMPGGLGLVINRRRDYTYVLWSMPSVLGYVSDGYLRKV